MTETKTPGVAPEPTPPVGFPNGPAIRQISLADVWAAFKAGVADFKRAPLFGLFFGAVYALGGLAILACLWVWDTPWAIIPLAVAFPLIGPFVAVGLYEVSRRISSGEPLSWRAVLGVVFRQKDRELVWMGFVMLFVFWMWAYQVRLLLALFLGSSNIASLDKVIETLTTTPDGLTFLAVGTVIGGFIALVFFSLTVMSVPLLLDHDVDFVTALVTSVATVRRYPAPMILWGIAVLVMMLAALAPAFLGLLVVLPVLGHATWRLYERAIVRAPDPAPA